MALRLRSDGLNWDIQTQEISARDLSRRPLDDGVNRISHSFVFPFMLCSVLCSLDALAAWGGKSVQREISVERIFVQDGASNNLGIFAGIVQTMDRDGLFKSAYLIMSPQGYLMPIHAYGEVVVVEPVYFQSKDCSGPEYVQVSSRHPVFSGLPGTVFQGALKKSLMYIPAESVPLTATVHSFIDRKTTSACISEDLIGTFYSLAANDPAVTGHGESEIQGPLALDSGRDTTSKVQENHRIAGNTSAAAPEIDANDYQEECSPGCLAEDVNNGICDIACWTATCDYDGHDCESLSQIELNEKLRTICSPGCFEEDINDGFCDALCNVEICNYDGDDCVGQ